MHHPCLKHGVNFNIFLVIFVVNSFVRIQFLQIYLIYLKNFVLVPPVIYMDISVFKSLNFTQELKDIPPLPVINVSSCFIWLNFKLRERIYILLDGTYVYKRC